MERCNAIICSCVRAMFSFEKRRKIAKIANVLVMRNNHDRKKAVLRGKGVGVARNNRNTDGCFGQEGAGYMPSDLRRSGMAQRPMATFVAPQIFVIKAFCLYQAKGSKMVSKLMSRSTVAKGHIFPRRMAL